MKYTYFGEYRISFYTIHMITPPVHIKYPAETMVMMVMIIVYKSEHNLCICMYVCNNNVVMVTIMEHNGEDIIYTIYITYSL